MNSGYKVLSLLLIILVFSIIAAEAQERETAIITMDELIKFMHVINNLEVSINQHEWAIVYTGFIDSAFTDTLKEGDEWKNLFWLGRLFYPEYIADTPEASIKRANSITSLKHFISDIKVFKEAGCNFYIIFKGVRIIDFELGRKYIPMEMQFCYTGEKTWVLKVPPE